MSKCRSLGEALAALPDLTDKIVKSDDQYCEAGGFSDVFKRQYDSGAGLVEVAVKSFRFPFTLDETRNEKNARRSATARKMLRRELGIWRRLEHSNIVPFLGIAYGFGRQGNASLVSLWMSNGSLQSFLGECDDRLTIAHRLQLLLDIANGLCYLHSFPVIHGDLSCNNVLLDHNYNACLTDFGHASMAGDMPEGSVYLQMTTMKPGTLRWAAPEHFSPDAEEMTQPTIKSDIYSFGNLGILILSGKHPWSEIQRDAAVMLQLSKGNKPQRPTSRPIEDQYWELVERCWASVDHRPCADDVVSTLQRFLCSFPPPLPLLDMFRVFSHSSTARLQSTLVLPTPNYSEEQHAHTLELDIQSSGLPKITLDHQDVVFQDGTPNVVVAHDIHQNAGIRRDKEEKAIARILPQCDPARGNRSTALVSNEAQYLRQVWTNTEEPPPCASTVADKNNSGANEQKAQGLGDTATKRISTKFLTDVPANQESVGGMNEGNQRNIRASTKTRHWQQQEPLTRMQTCNVIFIGETGAGKSSVINLVADRPCAAASPDAVPCMHDFAAYEVSIEGRTYQLWDTPGLYQRSIFCHKESARRDSLKRFIQERRRRMELDILVLCVRGSRAGDAMLAIYSKFCRATRQIGIPVVIVVTHLERTQPTMDTWWYNNEWRLGNRGLIFDGHACVTCLSPSHRRWASQRDIRTLISSEYPQRPLDTGEEWLSNKSCTIC